MRDATPEERVAAASGYALSTTITASLPTATARATGSAHALAEHSTTTIVDGAQH